MNISTGNFAQTLTDCSGKITAIKRLDSEQMKILLDVAEITIPIVYSGNSSLDFTITPDIIYINSKEELEEFINNIDLVNFLGVDLGKSFKILEVVQAISGCSQEKAINFVTEIFNIRFVDDVE